MIKCSQMIWYTPGATVKYFADYSTYFSELCKEVQDEIISRTVIE